MSPKVRQNKPKESLKISTIRPLDETKAAGAVYSSSHRTRKACLPSAKARQLQGTEPHETAVVTAFITAAVVL